MQRSSLTFDLSDFFFIILGQCGTCWAFSAAETIESEWKFQGNDIWEFSIQQIASCTTTSNGCGGGN